MTSKIIFRADGNSDSGLGHLYRIFAVVEMLKAAYECILLTKQTSQLDVIPNDYNTHLIPTDIHYEDEARWIKHNYRSNSKTIIADGYQFNENYQKSIKNEGFNLVYIDDLSREYMYADVIINHSLGFSHLDYRKEAYTRCYLGTKYALLRPLFLETAKKAKVIKPIDTLFICFGGSDTNDLTLKALNAALNISKIENINIVVGAAYKKKDIYDVMSNKQINIYKNLSESSLLKVMLNSNLALVPSSNILYEICCVKMPTMSGYYVENQKGTYFSLKSKKVIYGIGDMTKFESVDFEKAFTNFLNSNEKELLIKNQSDLFDGLAKQRILSILEQINCTYRIREAREDDIKLFFEWANEKQTRLMSINKSTILFEDHVRWFKNQINSDESKLLVLEQRKLKSLIPVGQVKFNKDGVIGIALDKNFRGKGLSSLLIKKGIEYYWKNTPNKCDITAVIRKDNSISAKSFVSVGFKYYADIIIDNEEYLEYKYKKSKHD